MALQQLLESFLANESRQNNSLASEASNLFYSTWLKQCSTSRVSILDLANASITEEQTQAFLLLQKLEQNLAQCAPRGVLGLKRRWRIHLLSAAEEAAEGAPLQDEEMPDVRNQPARKRRCNEPVLASSHLTCLPPELLTRICSILDTYSQISVACTCRVLRAAAEVVLALDPAVVARRIVNNALTMCNSLAPTLRSGALQEVSMGLELEARISFARAELVRRTKLVQSGGVFSTCEARAAFSELSSTLCESLVQKEILRLGRLVELQMAYLYHMQPGDPCQEDEVRLSSQQVDTVKSLSQALPQAMDEEERGWFDWHAFPLHKRDDWDPTTTHVLRVFLTIASLPVVVEVIGPWSTSLTSASEIRIFTGGAGGRRELVVIYSQFDGIDFHRWARVEPLFAPLNTQLSPTQLCLFFILASTISEEGGFPAWLLPLLSSGQKQHDE